jgi:hypothetical protein
MRTLGFGEAEGLGRQCPRSLGRQARRAAEPIHPHFHYLSAVRVIPYADFTLQEILVT